MTTFLILLIVVSGLYAQITLPALFSDNMILQQKSSVPVWGWAKKAEMIEVTTSWNGKAYNAVADKDGSWRVMVATPQYGGPYTITVSGKNEIVLKNVMIGEVWLCAGQSNMEMPMKGFMGQPVKDANMAILQSRSHNIRLISVPRKSKAKPQDNFEGNWEEASPETVAEFSATGYFFGRLLNKTLDIPVGLINVSYGGSCIQAWMSKNTSTAFEDRQIPDTDEDIGEPNRTPTALFNGMLNPVIGYGIKGAIWYQGETNYIEPDKYLELFPAMVKEWRELWGRGNFPFYYAQIAPFDYSVFRGEKVVEKHNSAYLRDAQRKAAEIIPNSAMAVLLDVGCKEGIHPMYKETAGNRLAFLALGHTYGISGFTCDSPSFNAMEIKGSVVTVSFKQADIGITSYGKEVTLFEVAGEDKRFYPANIVLRRKSLLLSSPKVRHPVAIRYAFRDYVKGEIFSNAGLPLSSFRTDNW
jgi:sialate O-acetylesterase